MAKRKVEEENEPLNFDLKQPHGWYNVCVYVCDDGKMCNKMYWVNYRPHETTHKRLKDEYSTGYHVCRDGNIRDKKTYQRPQFNADAEEDVIVEDASEVVEITAETQPTPPKRRGRPPGSKNKAKVTSQGPDTVIVTKRRTRNGS